MATVVYDGVGSGGNLFAGTKFFVLQRVPDRPRWIGLVKDNGGEIVMLEKQADIIIADHARKKCPAGSISWKYIQDSVKAGELRDIEEYRCTPMQVGSRKVGSGQPTKQGRTLFTAEDDRVLERWVTKAARQGLSTKGNEIYRQLEAVNNRHTAQSWRDRWIKYIACRPRSDIADEPSPTHSGSPKPVTEVNQSVRKPTPRHDERTTPSRISPEPRRQTRPEASRSASRNPPADTFDTYSTTGQRILTPGVERPHIRKSAGGINFTQEEAELLSKSYDDILNIHPDHDIDAWMAWAAEYPNHTAQEWRDYFFKELKPLMEKRARRQSDKEALQSEPTSTTRSRSNSSKRESSWQTPKSGFRVSAAEISESPPPVEESTGHPAMDENLFVKHMVLLAEGLGLEVNFKPIICGRTIPLFALWQVVNSDELGGFDEVTAKRLWGQVARKLNFNTFTHPNAAKDLEACYKEVLTLFDEAEEEHNERNKDLTDSQEQAMIESQLRKTATLEAHNIEEEVSGNEAMEEDQDYDDNLDMSLSLRSQSALSSSGKRRIGHSHNNYGESSLPGSYGKRQRIDKGKVKELEIPSTPEDTNNHHIPKPSKEIDLSPTPSRVARRRIIEPETQEFHFPSQQDDVPESPLFISSSPPRRDTPHRNGDSAVSRGARKDSPTNLTAESEQEAELYAFIERHIALGYSQEHVIAALEATTMNTGDAGVVMEALQSGGSIPDNIQGVWTNWDDEALKDVDHPDYQRVVEKHGREGVVLRQRFLEDQKMAKELLDQGSVD